LAPITLASLLLSLMLFGLLYLGPSIRPDLVKNILGFAITALATVFTAFGISLFPASLPVGVIAATLCALAVIPPILGKLEAKYRKNGQAVYSTGVKPGAPNRFPGHITTNLLGALATSAIVWVVHTTDGFDRHFAGASGESALEVNYAAFNITLPLATVVVFAFVRWQQVDACRDIDARVKRGDADWENQIVGYSLRHPHQLANVFYLIGVTFTAATTILYLVAYAMARSKANDPLAISWQVVVTIVICLSFLYACGSPRSRENRAVYLTFLTGTPAALCGVLVWLSLFEGGVARDFATISIVGIGYIAYCIEVVLGSRSRGEKLELHYFSAAGVATVLVVLLGALYVS